MTDDDHIPPPVDPSVSANRGSVVSFPKRFYAAVDTRTDPHGFALTLDGRNARTPAKSLLVLPTLPLAEAVADEWRAVGQEIDPRQMPFTRFANSVIDGVSRNMGEVLAEVLRYAASDLVVYRADGPAELIAAQRKAWDPLTQWSADALKAPLTVTEGIIFVAQSDVTLTRLEAAMGHHVGQGDAAAFRLAALHVVTTLTGSALLSLAVAAGRLTTDEAWAAAHVDEDYQIARWGTDDEAIARRAARWTDMKTAGALLELAPVTR